MALDELGAAGLRIPRVVVEDVVDRLYLAAPQFAPEDLAGALGVRLVVTREIPAGFDGLAFGDVVSVRQHRDERRTHLATWHELAHVLADRVCPRALHGDVWRLTLALAAPRAWLATIGPVTRERLELQRFMPPWAAAERVRMVFATWWR
jgi:hypothetical protein